jgi:uncharacterized membrane protein
MREEEGWVLKVIEVEQSIIVNLAIEQIFAYVSNFDNLVDWSGIVVAVKRTSPREMKVGATLRNTLRFLGRGMECEYEVVEYEDSHHITLKSTSGPAPCLFYYRFEPVVGSGTRISQKAVIQINPKGGLLGLAEPVIRNAAQRQVENDLLTLKDLLESGASMNGSPV